MCQMLYVRELYELFIEPVFTVVMKTDRIMWAVHRISSSDSERQREFWIVFQMG
jgi:hypothetical protein